MKHSICKTCLVQFEYANKGRTRVFCSVECYRSEQRKSTYKKEKKKLDFNVFLEKAKLVHGGRYKYKENNNLLSNGDISAICEKHGEFSQLIHNHLKGHGCKSCGFEENSKKQRYSYCEFIQKSREKHGNKYIYENPESFNGLGFKVLITCKTHGVFSQDAKAHIAGKGCRKCSMEDRNTVWNADTYSRLCKERHGGVARLYVIRCYNDKEEFYKVGITTRTVSCRFRGVKSMPYNFHELRSITGNVDMIHGLERQIHRIMKPKKYKPMIKFGGSNECFSEVDPRIMSIFEDSKQILLI